MIKFWRSYWFSPAPYFDLAVVRVVAVTVQLFITLIYFDWLDDLALRAALPDSFYQPLPVLNILNLPFGWGYRPSIEALTAIHYITTVAGFLSLVGLLTNVSLIVFAAGSVYLQAFLYSFIDFHHPPQVMMIALSALALSPCGKVLSLDWFLARWRSAGGFDRRTAVTELIERKSEFAGWPIRLLQWFFVLMYLSAVVSKLFKGGLDWANGYTLQYYLVQDGLRWASPLALWLSDQHVLVWIMQCGVLIFQVTFALAVIFPKLRWIYVPAGLGLHLGIFLTLKAPFFQWIGLYAVFIPWSEALRMARERLAERRRPVSANAPL